MYTKAHLRRDAQWKPRRGGATVWKFEVTDLMNYCQTLIQSVSKGSETPESDHLNLFLGYDVRNILRTRIEWCYAINALLLI